MIILRNIKIPYDKDQKFLREKIEKEINKKDFKNLNKYYF